MRTIDITIPDPTRLPRVDIDYDTGTTVVTAPTAVVAIPIGVGVPGRDGAALDRTQVWSPGSPAATWTIPHTFGRYVDVSLLVDGVEVETDVYQPDTHTVVLVFPMPTFGTVILS